jgi:hypothetical protein
MDAASVGHRDCRGRLEASDPECPWALLRCGGLAVRYSGPVATTLDKDKLHDVLDQAVIVIDERDLERSRKDPRVRAFHESSARLMAELEAEGANYD